MNYNVRIDDNFLRGDHVDGEVLQHTDLNELENVAKTAINANYEDIQKLQDGTIAIGNSEKLGGATLSTFATETLQNSDTKVPTSLQAKQYIDNAISAIDLSGYYTKREVDSIADTKQDTLYHFKEYTDTSLNFNTADEGFYSTKNCTVTIGQDTLEPLVEDEENMWYVSAYEDGTFRSVYDFHYLVCYFITKSGSNYTAEQSILVDTNMLEIRIADVIRNTDYATTSAAGIIKLKNDYGTAVDTDGSLKAASKLYSAYNSASDNMFISKGTLRQVLMNEPITTLLGTSTNPTNLNTISAGKYILQEYYLIGTESFREITSGKLVVVSAYSNNKRTIYFVEDQLIYEVTKNGNTYTITNTTHLTTKEYVDDAVSNIDLTDYVKNTDYATYDKGGTIKVDGAYGLYITGGFLMGANKSYATYQSAQGNLLISKQTLENVITGKGLVSNTDYAGINDPGVVKASNTYGFYTLDGEPYAGAIFNYSQYADADPNAFVAVGTLDTVIEHEIGNIAEVLNAINGESVGDLR